jgi:protein-L-isoaspartate O-methyltransferase
MADWRSRAADLADEIRATVDLSPAWHAAFASTPRHVFVPRFYGGRGGVQLLADDDPDTHSDWLAGVYRDETLVTALTVIPGTDLRHPSGEAVRPSLTAWLLRHLDVQGGMRVLQVGIDTGYTAALLCRRLGDGRVAAIDRNPVAAAQAGERLAGLGQRPFLAARDMGVGVVERAPFDRILVTAPVPTIATAWIAQLRSGGRILANLRGDLAGGLFVGEKNGPGRVAGHVGGPVLPPRVATDVRPPDYTASRTGQTRLSPSVLADPGLRLALQLHDPAIMSVSAHTDWHGAPLVRVWVRGGSWAEASVNADAGGRHSLVQGGPRDVWGEVERVAAAWIARGRPDPQRFGLTVSVDGMTALWVDQPVRELWRRDAAESCWAQTRAPENRWGASAAQ